MARPTSRVSRVVVRGPLAPFVEAYREALKERRYTPLSAVNLQRQMAELSRWLEADGVGVERVDEVCVELFLSSELAGGRHRASLSRPGLVCLVEVLRDLGVVPPAVEATPSPMEALLGSFRRYLLSERGLAAGTVCGYVDRAARFMAGRAPSDLSGVTAVEVTAAVLEEAATVSVSTTQNFVAGLRAFLRFCFIEGLIAVDLSQAALPITGRRRSSLPGGITKNEAAALVSSCDRRTAIGRRDYAMITTLLRLGLRRGEVADSGWKTSTGGPARSSCWARAPAGDRLPLPV